MGRGYYLPEPGDTVAGRYKIKRYLARGGFGAVFVAEQIGVGREVAVKTILPQVAIDPSYMERFKREAYLIKDLISPHTIRLYDFGRTEEGLLYLVMELLNGVSLQKILEQETFDDERAFHVISQVLKSLIEAHQRGIIHRDIKPENIMLIDIPGEKKEFVKVLDFGIGKATGTDSESMKQLTQTGTGIGTPSYMAPELLRGKSVGPWSDLYSTGLILIELLSGKVAVFGETPIVIAAMQLMPGPVEIPASISSSQLVPVIQKATAKEKNERYQNAEEFLDAMEEIFSPYSQSIDILNTPTVLINLESQELQSAVNNLKTEKTSSKGEIYVTPSWSAQGSRPDSEVVIGSTRHDPSARTRAFPGTPPTVHKSEPISLPKSRKKRILLSALAVVFILLACGGYLLLSPSDTSKEKHTDKPTEQSLPDNIGKPDDITIVISSIPPRAQVFDGKQNLGETPYQEKRPKDSEPFDFTLKLKGHENGKVFDRPSENQSYEVILNKSVEEKTGAREIEVLEKKTETEVVEEKIEIVVKINSEPDGATVYSGKKKIGKTPMELPISADAKPRKLRLRKRGYHSKDLKITPKKQEINAKLRPRKDKDEKTKTSRFMVY